MPVTYSRLAHVSRNDMLTAPCRKRRHHRLTLVSSLCAITLGCTPLSDSENASYSSAFIANAATMSTATTVAGDDTIAPTVRSGRSDGGMPISVPSVQSHSTFGSVPAIQRHVTVDIELGPLQPDDFVSNSPADVPDILEGAAPHWPFSGLVQLWQWEPTSRDAVWWLLYTSLDDPEIPLVAVALPGLSVTCLGQLGLVSHGPEGIEVGGDDHAASGSMRIPWGGYPTAVGQPSAKMLKEIEARPSNVGLNIAGDLVEIGVGDLRQEYAMRTPPRLKGNWWRARARYEDRLLIVSARPSQLPCLNNVTWVIDGPTGQPLACGTNTPAFRLITASDEPVGHPILPDADRLGGVAKCTARLDPAYLVWQYRRLLSTLPIE